MDRILIAIVALATALVIVKDLVRSLAIRSGWTSLTTRVRIRILFVVCMLLAIAAVWSNFQLKVEENRQAREQYGYDH
jgi:hypothetical protein